MAQSTICTLQDLVVHLSNLSSFEECADYVKSLGLMAKYETRGPTASNRLLITHDRFSDFDSELSFQANGVVYDVVQKKVVCVPSPGFNCRAVYTEVIANLDKYMVYPVSDGTMVNLYWYGDKWTIGSTHGFELNAYKWMGPNTYEQELRTVLGKYPEFTFDGLDKGVSYNIGFRTDAFHPLHTDPSRAWLVSAWRLDTLIPVADANIGIPMQTPAAFTIAGTPKERFDWLLQQSSGALKQYFANRTHHNYGWILRSTDYAVTQGSSHVMIESSLMRKVRQLAYNLPKNPRLNLNETNRFEYMTLRAWLSYQLRSSFVDMFPETHQRYTLYTKTVHEIIDRMVKCYRNRNLHEKLVSGARVAKTITVDTLAYTFMADIDKQGKLTVDTRMNNIIYNYIVDIRYIDLYMKLLNI